MAESSIVRFVMGATLASLLLACKLGSLMGGGEDAGTSAAPTGDSPTIGVGGPPPAGGRSAVPTLAEWGQVGEVTVKGSSALGCSTKIVREWFRVSCSGRNDSGGTPTNVTVRRGGGSDRYTFVQGGVTSLVMPFVEGTDVEAVFSWTDKSHVLAVRWPRGAPRPGIVGVFQGASSPLDCVECMSEGDEGEAKAKGKTCCPTKTCKSRGECGGKQCCIGPIGDGVCRTGCDLANTSPTCSSDAECPTAFGKKLTCKPHQAGGGLRTCQ